MTERIQEITSQNSNRSIGTILEKYWFQRNDETVPIGKEWVETKEQEIEYEKARVWANDAKILYQAREKALDYNTIEKLNNLNPDFCEFIKKLSKVMNATKDYTTDAKNSFEKICDKVFESDEEQETYCKKHNIPF